MCDERDAGEDSPSKCDWRAAVQRMNEEGLVHLDS